MRTRPRGRPPKADDERRDDQLNFRVTEDERAEIEQAAEITGTKVSDWIRTRIVSAARRAITKAEE